MQRRRLRICYSSDEELEHENQQQRQQQDENLLQEEVEEEDEEDEMDVGIQEPAVTHQTVILNPVNPNPNSNMSDPLRISDDDDDQIFIDVSDNLSPPSPDFNHSSQQPPQAAPAIFDEAPDCPISNFLLRLGLKVKRVWLDACVHGLERSVSGFAYLDVSVKAKLCFEQYLVSDMNFIGSGVLPANVDSMHLVDLPGPYILQVDEIVNINCPLRGRYQTAPPSVKRCLKLSMTDGVQRVFGMEYRPIKALEVLAPAGLKVGICNVHIRHGLLMLVPESIDVLGGLVEEQDAARQRLVDEVNKPPRGRRTRTGVVPPLATRATRAAWPSDDANGLGNRNNTANLQVTVPSVSNPEGVNTLPRTNGEFSVPVREGNTFPSDSASTVRLDLDRTYRVPNTSSNTVSTSKDIHMVDIEHPLILSADREAPFTYLACLSAKWAAMIERTPSVQGKIKCFLTGVKGFQYKQRTTYDLRVYVDDGSLISEVHIDHNVVQKGIGHSPKDVTAALSSSNAVVVGDMKDTLRQYQLFLASFEGMMVVEMNHTSSLPVALEMIQGFPKSDARMLLMRLKSLMPSPQTGAPPSLVEPIESP